MMGTTISTKAADSRMFDFYDKLIGLGLGIGIYSGEQLKANRAIHNVIAHTFGIITPNIYRLVVGNKVREQETAPLFYCNLIYCFLVPF